MMKISNECPKGEMEPGGQAENRSKADLSDQSRLFSALMGARGKAEQESGNLGRSQGHPDGQGEGGLFSQLKTWQAVSKEQLSPALGEGLDKSLGRSGTGESGDMERDRGAMTGESILASFSSRTAAGPEIAPAGPGGAGALSRAARAICEGILVSDPRLYSRQEVRIVLKEAVLPDTEILIAREGGTTRVTLVTTSNDAYRVLSEQKEGMQHYLNHRLDGEVRVGLQVRTRGTDPGHSDGRSRQRRDLVNEWEEED